MRIKSFIIIISLLFLPLTVSAQGVIELPKRKTEVSKPKRKPAKKRKLKSAAKPVSTSKPARTSKPVQTTKPTPAPKPQGLHYNASTGELVFGSHRYKMVRVEGGSFNMGATPEQNNPEMFESPVHRVTLTDYYIGQTEVPQWLWKAVMGNNPSCFKGDNLPVERVSWNDCQAFLKKLNKCVNQEFTLPSEAQWEYAARGGNRSRGYQYSGSDHLSDVAWYDSLSTHEVATKKANEAGIYDMSGNVEEWCADWWGDYAGYSVTNPRGATSGSRRVFRGGDYKWGKNYCRVSYRRSEFPDRGWDTNGFRIVMNVPSTLKLTYNYTTGDLVYGEHSYKMVYVEGGTFLMGATKEQKSPDDIEKPVHQVTLSGYYIGQTEVPQWLWVAVMGSNPSKWEGDNLPVEWVSWNECREFMRRLNDITGKQFSLPTEAQWEYAARGGKHSQGYQYSGSKKPETVAWYKKNSDKRNHEVTDRKAPNELGLYDMSGNVWELCNDRLGPYPEGSVTDPVGAASGNYRVIRGGSWDDKSWGCRVAIRGGILPDGHSDNAGFRLALQ